MTPRSNLDPVSKTIFAVLAIAAGLWSTGVAVIAFTGGTVPYADRSQPGETIWMISSTDRN